MGFDDYHSEFIAFFRSVYHLCWLFTSICRRGKGVHDVNVPNDSNQSPGSHPSLSNGSPLMFLSLVNFNSGMLEIGCLIPTGWIRRTLMSLIYIFMDK